jgi:hypothetical protein
MPERPSGTAPSSAHVGLYLPCAAVRGTERGPRGPARFFLQRPSVPASSCSFLASAMTSDRATSDRAPRRPFPMDAEPSRVRLTALGTVSDGDLPRVAEHRPTWACLSSAVLDDHRARRNGPAHVGMLGSFLNDHRVGGPRSFDASTTVGARRRARPTWTCSVLSSTTMSARRRVARSLSRRPAQRPSPRGPAVPSAALDRRPRAATTLPTWASPFQVLPRRSSAARCRAPPTWAGLARSLPRQWLATTRDGSRARRGKPSRCEARNAVGGVALRKQRTSTGSGGVDAALSAAPRGRLLLISPGGLARWVALLQTRRWAWRGVRW